MVTRLIEKEGQHYLPIADELLNRLGIDGTTPLDTQVEDGRLIVSAAQVNGRDLILEKILDEIDAEYGDVLQRLAK